MWTIWCCCITTKTNSKDQLWRWRDAIAEFLRTERLMLHPRKTQVQPVGLGLNLLGYRVWPRISMIWTTT